MHGTGLASDIHDFVKQNKLISKGLGLIPHPAAQLASKGASLLGYGRKRKGQRGRGIFNDIGSGIGNVFGGLGSGIGSVAHGLFGGGAVQSHMRVLTPAAGVLQL